ncbi:putative protein C2orf42 [Liparis tanakae]|uniref:Uncharacterized protein n=1 Tax=Liparis tanakae TaxID=230148 RepID=A0A4Z2FMS0_9TELE|nr:putative protein C2orf42 [Liparis tanakae]
MGFQQWLAGVTERIHQAMHYQFDGKPPPLVFHIPQEFFIALQQRLSLGSKKRRLPNFTTALLKNDGLTLGSKYTWHVTNLLQVKRIFDTSEVKNLLQFTGLFPRGMISKHCSPESRGDALFNFKYSFFFRLVAQMKASFTAFLTSITVFSCAHIKRVFKGFLPLC